MSTPADAAAVPAAPSGKRTARHKAALSNKEDPRHTWNQQLMEACLACDLTKIKELVERGADPVNARETPPPAFYSSVVGKTIEQQLQLLQGKDDSGQGGSVAAGETYAGYDGSAIPAAGVTSTGLSEGHSTGGAATAAAGAAATSGGGVVDKLPPLAMMLLSGNNSEAARDVIAYLIHCGASINDTFSFAVPHEELAASDAASIAAAAAAAAGADGLGDGISGGGNGGNANSGGEDASAGGRSGANEAKKNAKKKASVAVSRSHSAALGADGMADAAAAAAATAKHEEVSVSGTILHYVVSRADHAQLLRLLLLAGPSPTPASSSSSSSPTAVATVTSMLGNLNAVGAARGVVALPYSLLNAVEQETVVGALRQHQLATLRQSSARSTSISKASAGTTENASQRGKAKVSGASPSASVPVSPSHTLTSTSVSGAAGGGGAFVISAAAAESMLTALQQRQSLAAALPSANTPSAAVGTGGVGGGHGVASSGRHRRPLPVLMTVYPYKTEESGSGLHNGSGQGGDKDGQESKDQPAMRSDLPSNALDTVPATWWHLRDVCNVTAAAPTESAPQDEQTINEDNTVSENEPQNNNTQTLSSLSQQQQQQRLEIDLTLLDSFHRSATTIALARGDTLTFRLLHFFGAPMPFGGLVNATQTRLARACARGDVARVEQLLKQGDAVSQISADGRYSLVHYAAAQPEVLRVLTEHGLSLEYENAYGESAVLSLLRHGTARNDGKYVQTLYTVAAGAITAPETFAAPAGSAPSAGTASATTTTASTNNTAAAPASPTTTMVVAAPLSVTARNAVAFTQLTPAAQRNYILCPPLPLPNLTQDVKGGGGAGGNSPGRSAATKERSTSSSARRASGNTNTTQASFLSGNAVAALTATTTNSAGQVEKPFLGGREAGTWWSFLSPTTTTADVIDALLKAGAVLQGYIPDDDLDLPYVRFAEAQATAGNDGNNSMANSNNNNNSSYYDDADVEEALMEESYASRASLSGSAHTAVPTRQSSSSRLKGPHSTRRPQPFPGRLPLRLTPLQQAILDYHPELIRRLVMDYRVDPMQRDSQGATAIHYAALCTHAPSVLELLLSPQVMQMHARTTAGGGNGGGGGGGAAATSSAANAGNGSGAFEAPISVAAAVNSKVDINAADMAGRTPLFYAALVGNEDAVRLLLRFGSLAQVGRADRDGWTPLHVAVRQQHPAVVEALLQHSNHLLSTAAAGGSDAAMELLNTPGSAAGARRPSVRSYSGRRTSHRSGSLNAAAGGSGRARRSITNASSAGLAGSDVAASPIEFLYANGGAALVDVEAEEKQTHMTALEMLMKQPAPYTAVTAAQLRMATALLAEGQASSMRPSGLASGGSLLHRVVADGHVEFAELLLSFYAEVDEVDDNDETPLFLAVRQPRLSTERADIPPSAGAGIAEKGAQHGDVNAWPGRTALIRVLLQYNATPYAQSGANLLTPLHLAAQALATPADDIEELVQLLFYTAPDRKANAAGRHRRADARANRSRDHRVLSRVLDAMEAESATQSQRGSTGSNYKRAAGAATANESALRRRLNRNNNNNANPNTANSGSGGGSLRGSRRPSSQDGVGSSPRQRASQPATRRGNGTGGAGRRKPWATPANSGGADAFDGIGANGEVSGEETTSAFVNSSFASGGHNTSCYGDDTQDDRSITSSQFDGADNTMPQRVNGTDANDGESATTTAAAAAAAEGEEASGVDQRRLVLRQWQSADHLLSPSHCWLLTNAQGQTPLHVLCHTACRAVHRLPALLKLLADLQTATRQRDAASGVSSEHDVLNMLWGLPDAHGRTPLHAAAECGFAEAVEMVSAMCPASVTAVDAQGRTPLHACVLMKRDLSAFSSSSLRFAPATVAESEKTQYQQQQQEEDVEKDEEADYAARLSRILRTLRDRLRDEFGDNKMVPLHGLPLRRTGRDVLPTSFHTAADVFAAANTHAESTRAHVVAALVQSSTITAQLQRWQATRHWGAPTLMPTSAAEVSAEGEKEGVSASWRTYTQLTDGQGRTALLLAAEIGNRSAARELLRQP